MTGRVSTLQVAAFSAAAIGLITHFAAQLASPCRLIEGFPRRAAQ
jgi:hypothetical protein